MRRKGIILVLAAAVAIALCAGAAGAKPQQSVRLSFFGPVENRAQWDAIIGNFERQFPNIHIEATYTPGAGFGPLLLTQFQSGSAPDLCPTGAGASQNFGVFPLGFQGKLLDLTGSPGVKRIYPGVVKFVSVHRRIYGFPADCNLSGLFSPTADWPRVDKGLDVPQFVALVPGLFTGQRTVDQILQTMDEFWDKP